jgi:nuclear transport factor 2 (NTF2) superfamily protein
VKENLINMKESKLPMPPFTEASAKEKIQLAEDAWNSQDPIRISMAYTIDSEWRNRSNFIVGREEIQKFLKNKWENELEYQLRKEYWAHTENRIAVRFEYEYRNRLGQWFRACGNENWEFDAYGLMRKRFASINDLPINEHERYL